MTTSSRVPPAVPANAACSISLRLSTVGNALRFASVVPCRRAREPRAPTRCPNRYRPGACRSCRLLGWLSSTGLPEKRHRCWPRSQGRRPNRGSHSCAAIGPDLQRRRLPGGAHPHDHRPATMNVDPDVLSIFREPTGSGGPLLRRISYALPARSVLRPKIRHTLLDRCCSGGGGPGRQPTQRIASVTARLVGPTVCQTTTSAAHAWSRGVSPNCDRRRHPGCGRSPALR
jgi:hypothetical protein